MTGRWKGRLRQAYASRCLRSREATRRLAGQLGRRRWRPVLRQAAGWCACGPPLPPVLEIYDVQTSFVKSSRGFRDKSLQAGSAGGIRGAHSWTDMIPHLPDRWDRRPGESDRRARRSRVQGRVEFAAHQHVRREQPMACKKGDTYGVLMTIPSSFPGIPRRLPA